MDEYELKKRNAEVLRECIFKIPRRNREYEMTYQPVIQISSAGDMRVNVRFVLKYKKNNIACRMQVESDGVFVHAEGLGAYLDKLFLKGKPDVVCSEFVKWMKFARNGVIDGDYAYMFYYDKPVGFMVRPADKKYSYAFFAKEIESCGLLPESVFRLYSSIQYDGNRITCKKADCVYLPMQAFGKGIQPVNTLELEIKRSLIWSMLCMYSLRQKK